jgi:hypothetical protein
LKPAGAALPGKVKATAALQVNAPLCAAPLAGPMVGP